MKSSFQIQLDKAINEFKTHGYRDAAILAMWLLLLRNSLKDSLPRESEVDEKIKQRLTKRFDSVYKRSRGFPQHKLDQIRPDLRAELGRRIDAAESLSVANREKVVDDVMRRFEGWATSIPVGGSEISKIKTKSFISQPISKIKLDDKRVIEDQEHKLDCNVESIIADKLGAIAAIWHSKWRQGEPYRHHHKAIDQKVYAVRGNWAIQDGLMKVGDNGYSDSITQPGVEPYCRCTFQYLYNISELPDIMKTRKGMDATV